MTERNHDSSSQGSRRSRRLVRFGWLLPLGATLIGVGILVVTYAFASIPLPADIRLSSAAEVYDRNGRLIGVYSGEERRFLIDTTKLPSYVGRAVIASEDHDFYNHGGISIEGILRAAWADLKGGEITQGGSTIAQQYIKNAVLHDTSRTISRKLKEAVLAVKLERRYSKDEILGFYLNTIYFGRGAYGIEAAARTYFNKHATKLTLGQAAYLAGIIPSPESYQPDDNPAGARARRNHVLRVMRAQGYVTARQAWRAARGKVRLAKSAKASVKRQRAAYFMEWLRKEHLEPEFGQCLYTCGLKIFTTLDLRMQSSAERAVASVLTEPTDPEAALVSVTPRGAVRAFVGGRRFSNVRKARGFNFASDNARQAGSAFKPFTLLTAIEQGISPQSRFSGYSPATISDPECANPDGTPWRPENYGGAQYGTISLDQATTFSVNTVYAQLIARVGPENVARLLERFGFEPPHGQEAISPNCSLALGGSDLDATPVEMTRAYAGFTARGALPQMRPLRFVEDTEGNCLRAYLRTDDVTCARVERRDPQQVVRRRSADVLNQVLTHVVQGGTATAASIGRPVAGKTGTTENNRDAWFAGSVPQLTTVVWMGYRVNAGDDRKMGTADDFTPLMQYCADPELCRPVHGIEVVGGTFPAQIWAAYMREATANMPVKFFPTPERLPGRVINPAPPQPAYTPLAPSPSGPPEASPTPSSSSPPSVPDQPSPSAPPVSPPPSSSPSIGPSPTRAMGWGRGGGRWQVPLLFD